VVSDDLLVGVIMGQSNDVGASIAGAPSPITTQEARWQLFDWLQYDGATSLDRYAGTQVQYDLRSMRKFQALSDSYNLVLASTKNSAFPLNSLVFARILLKLP
jgi:hypothetical protein